MREQRRVLGERGILSGMRFVCFINTILFFLSGARFDRDFGEGRAANLRWRVIFALFGSWEKEPKSRRCD